jgi:hypothetical protein
MYGKKHMVSSKRLRPAPRQTQEKYSVEVIMNVRGSGKSRRYLVAWEGYGEEEQTWEPAAHLDDQLVADFEARHAAEARHAPSAR